ncbi:Aldehyde dehydrogenase [hydrothermal vent metagenome]|uniref:Aldehyde dehydrogenase n=1 Tax=hydrothermal vent metagenome TaxID=652676 RepID=A0A3B0Z3P9_9ZZZZ
MKMTETLQIVSPVDGCIYAERPFTSERDIRHALDLSVTAQAKWRQTPLAQRLSVCLAAVDALLKNKQTIGEELSWQMGRPIQYAPDEIDGFAERARYMISIAEQHLSDIPITDSASGVTRYIQREPVGVVFSIAPWNYPYLTAVNSIIPAIVAGNSVLMKPSSQTAITAERIAEAFQSANLPEGVFQHLLLTHEATVNIVAKEKIDYVAFTGSVEGGRIIERAAAGRFIDVGLELGGKDPAYVRADADVAFAIENIADGGFFNSGQSCCAIERIYVHRDVYRPFVDGLVDRVSQYRLGDPLDPETSLGPMVRTSNADRVRQQIQQALAKGAQACIDDKLFAVNPEKQGMAYLAPQVLVNVDHTMPVMSAETFGPVVGIMQVVSDQQAIQLMNDSAYGLTASVWTQNQQVAVDIGKQVRTGTWFMNRCDYLDPALAWTGIKHSGKGCSLSGLAYQRLTRPKSFYLRVGH